jgi:hypothetical protein
MRVPSLLVLRAFFRPSPVCYTQTRTAAGQAGWMKRERFAQVKRVDKLHRKMKAADKQKSTFYAPLPSSSKIS